MRIALQVSDLDHARIDGTRVYLKELLKRFGKKNQSDNFLLYHKGVFNPLLAPPRFANYTEISLPFPYAWMQTRFLYEIFLRKPDKLFLPIQAAPFFVSRKTKVIATIHDLAFKKYPETFTWKMLWKLNWMLERAVKRADTLIAVSQSTKNDLLEYFPELPESKVRVIHHGFDASFFETKLSDGEIEGVLSHYEIQKKNYLLYVGALQPRKNLVRLIEAFEQIKEKNPEMKLVLAGEAAWLSKDILEKREHSVYKHDVVLTGRIDFETVRALYQAARVFAFPSLYEGFGLPLLEAFASGVPVLTADNSSLREVAGDAALYCDAKKTESIAEELGVLWRDETLQKDLIEKGKKRLEAFSWETCAEKTLEIIQNA